MTELEQVNAYIDKIAQIPALELSEAQLYLLALHEERNRLQKEVEAANECIEDEGCGATLECVKCGKPRPCLCMDAGSKQ